MHKIFSCLLLTYMLLTLFVASSVYAQSSISTHTISIEGTLLMLDDATPHVAVPVEVVDNEKVISTTLSNEAGKYQFINLIPGTYQLRCQVLGGHIYYGEEKARKSESRRAGESGTRDVSDGVISIQVRAGETLKDMDFRFAPFKKGVWKSYSRLDGLAGDYICVIYRDLDGNMWFGNVGDGVTRYGKEGFATFTTRDGLARDDIYAIYQTPDGAIWLGTGHVDLGGGGVSRYDGNTFVNLTMTDAPVRAIYQDTHGNLWFGTWRRGVYRYDGKTYTNFTIRDGLASNIVGSICQGSDGAMWFGTGIWWDTSSGDGVSRYDGEMFINFTTEDGLAHNVVNAISRTPDGDLWFGTLNGISRYDGKTFTNLTTEDGLVNDRVLSVYCDPDGILWCGTHYRGVSRYDGKTFVNFTKEDGLVDNFVSTIHQDPDGVVWFGTNDGVSRYDMETFINFAARDGLRGNGVWAICQDSDENMWLGSGWGENGVFCYDGEEFANLTTDDGLADSRVIAIHQAPDGVLWFGTENGGVSRYDGKVFANFTTADGLAGGFVTAIQHDLDGTLWFGAWNGISRYDGKTFTNFTREDGLPSDRVQTICRDHDGLMWIGTDGGISRYDGKTFVNFTTKDGLAEDYIWAIHQDLDGVMWFGMSTRTASGGGISCYDGKEFVNFSTEDGLAHDAVRDIHRDSDGILWVATYGGVSGYDGTTWTSLDTRDGLPSNRIRAIHQDSEGYLWFGADRGLTRYRRSDTSPRVNIASVTADETYDDLSAIPPFSIGKRITVKYNAIDLKTHPDKQQYRCRVRNSDALRVTGDGSMGLDWDKPAKQTTFDWIPEEAGVYTFQVQAIDRDLNYSEPASIELTVVPPFYLRAVFLIPTVGSGTIMSVALVILAIALTKRRRQVHAYQRLAVRELQDAREMQMSLLPESVPPVEGMEIAGRSIPANTVGGDFFDYLSLPDGRIGIAIGDVSGKGLKAAMNAVLASGMLYEVVKTEMSCGRILSVMNAGLCPRTEKQMFTAFSFAVINQETGVVQWSNAAQPLPIVRRVNGTSEADGDGQLPLGMAPNVRYLDYQLELQSDDTVIFYTDGIIEAENEAEEMYGTERLLNLVASIGPAASVEGVIEAILQDVSDFVGSAQQYDDMTIVAVKKV